ncbi:MULTISPECIES: heme exporter protein CcmD [unclassified Sphingomonas]|nr:MULTISPECIES: heme exporter protein CcmD [unclassified Sphingomonas]
MNHWAFITAAYGVTICGIVAITIASWVAMRRAERG